MTAIPPLHSMNPTRRFSDRAADYVRYRPSYPPEAIDAILDGLGPPAPLSAADIGAGTGISARLLAERGLHVLALEPNAEMRAAAEPHPLVTWADASAERTSLPDGSLDLVLCAQAFHWFRPEEAIAEFHRILKPGGRLALMWNSRDQNEPLTAGYTAAIRACSGEHPAEVRDVDPDSAVRSGMFTTLKGADFPYRQELDAAGLIGRALSASYVPKEGPLHESLLGRLRDLHRQHADESGHVHLVYITQVFLFQALAPA